MYRVRVRGRTVDQNILVDRKCRGKMCVAVWDPDMSEWIVGRPIFREGNGMEVKGREVKEREVK